MIQFPSTLVVRLRDSRAGKRSTATTPDVRYNAVRSDRHVSVPVRLERSIGRFVLLELFEEFRVALGDDGIRIRVFPVVDAAAGFQP